MKSHELAQILLKGPNLQVSTHANNHTAKDKNIRVCVMRVCGDESVGIGNFSRRHVNHPNDFVISEIDGGERLPDNWRY